MYVEWKWSRFLGEIRTSPMFPTCVETLARCKEHIYQLPQQFNRQVSGKVQWKKNLQFWLQAAAGADRVRLDLFYSTDDLRNDFFSISILNINSVYSSSSKDIKQRALMHTHSHTPTQSQTWSTKKKTFLCCYCALCCALSLFNLSNVCV